MKRSKHLPPFALEYLSAHSDARPVVEWFHQFLKRLGRSTLQFEWRDVSSPFAEFLSATFTPRTAKRSRQRIYRYFDWLRARSLLAFDPKLFRARTGLQLPSEAECFVKSLEPTRRPNTIKGYRAALRQFYLWLQSQRLDLNDVDRQHISTWLEVIHSRGMSAVQRVHLIQNVRMYFRWLEERPTFTGPPCDHLFRRSDVPKLPQYLPRPIPADVDQILQRRLRQSRSPLQLGLLLMRRTGLRIGELQTLPLQCVHKDHLDHHFLKVPVGKLNNERLVPLDEATLRVIEKLRRSSVEGYRGRRRRFLLESKPGEPVAYRHYQEAFRLACRGLVFAERMTSHRLRHTYATSMLVAGVSLPVLMKLLGHRDYRMTLRYTAITVQFVASEYASAMERIEQRYNLRKSAEATSAPAMSLADLARFLVKQVADSGGDSNAAHAIARQLQRLDIAVQRLLRDC